MSEAESFWKKCSSCKQSIAFGATYYVCSVSTCNALRTGYVFCSVHCFERHLPGARHKDAAAIEKKAPSAGQVPPSTNSPAAPMSEARSPARMLANATTSGPAKSSSSMPREVLVIASRLKEYIQARSDYSTSASVMDVLSDHLRVISDRAIDNARAEGRKTVMDRDFAFLKSMK